METIPAQTPSILSVSPMGRAFSTLQGLNRARMGKTKHRAILDLAFVHRNVSVEVCEMQHEGDRCFIHAHPLAASSWQAASVQHVMNMGGGMLAKADLCQYGMQSRDEQGLGYAKTKPTGSMAKPSHAARLHSKWCKGRRRHVLLVARLAAACQLYSPSLCLAILRAIEGQASHDDIIDPHGYTFPVCSEEPADVEYYDDNIGKL